MRQATGASAGSAAYGAASPPPPAAGLTVKLAPGAWRTESWSPPGAHQEPAAQHRAMAGEPITSCSSHVYCIRIRHCGIAHASHPINEHRQISVEPEAKTRQVPVPSSSGRSNVNLSKRHDRAGFCVCIQRSDDAGACSDHVLEGCGEQQVA